MDPSNPIKVQSDPTDTTHITLCSVCVATYKRPQLLENLLTSLKNQFLPENIRMEVIVVDNDPEESAQAIVKKFKSSTSVRYHYFTQPAKNISLTRNLAVGKASGEYILFIDDDEVASPQWLHHSLSALTSSGADGVFGPVIPNFNPQTPPWMQQSGLYYRAGLITTANCMVKASLLKTREALFDPRYGITGGEDVHLFHKLQNQGYRFEYCQEAEVTEYIPPNRTKQGYLFRRGLKGGNSYSRRAIEFAGDKHFCLRVFMIAKGFAAMLLSLALTTIFLPSALHRTRWLVKFASNLGKSLAAFGWYYQGYR